MERQRNCSRPVSHQLGNTLKVAGTIWDEETGIVSTTNYTNGTGAWYTLDGVKLDGKPTKKGLYIHGGKKVVVP